MRLQAVPILMTTLAFCSADRSWGRINTTPDPALVNGINAAKAFLNQYAPTMQVVIPTSSQVPTPASSQAPVTCYTQQQDVGACVKTSMCDLTPPKIDPATLFGYRMQNKSGNECAFLETCCPRDKVRLETNLPEPAFKPAPGCGYSNIAAGTFREWFGRSGIDYPDFDEFPWTVSLLWKSRMNTPDRIFYIAGGALIHPSVVLTVASVASWKADNIICRAGEWKTQNEKEPYIHQDREVKEIIQHEGNNNDIALMIMATPFVIQPHINVACLSPIMPPPGTLCYNTKWGPEFIPTKYKPSISEKITLSLVGPDECERSLRNTTLGGQYSLHHSFTCAVRVSNYYTSSANGRIPLVCPIGNPGDLRYAVVGMLRDSLRRVGPLLHTKVPEFYEWVNSQLSKRQISDRPYNLN